ncbi:sensor histidine kinase [Nocardiopsis halophila]|uniref:sensor histidine kinase n=1 Tax=Nocardiopsis halophila TaxID=141692 RepID=UPI00034BFEBF|nr:GAF domain-containing protein [Nocardiopsis halophila]
MTELPEATPRPRTSLDELLAELNARLQTELSSRDRVHSLLEAVLSIGRELDLGTVLRRLTQAAADLVDARYAGLGVIGEDGRFSEFIPVGLTEEQASRVSRFPHGEGLLAEPTRERRALRLGDLSRHPGRHGFPDGHPPMRSFLGVPIQVRDEVFGNLYLTEKRGAGQFDEDDEAVVTALATAAGVAIENARLYEETRRRERWLSASTDITTRLLSGEDPHDVLGLLARNSREMAGADIAVVLLPDPRGRELIAQIADGPVAGQILGTPLTVSQTACGAVYRHGEAVTIPDLRHADCPMLTHRGFGPGLLVPLGTPDRTRGVLLLAKKGVSSPFGATTRHMIDAFAGQAAVALELAEARRDAERLVVLEDRDRIAKDLHDVVIQRMFASAMTLMSTLRLVEAPQARDRIQHTIDDLDETIREIRSTVFALQTPPACNDTSLRGRILDAAEGAARSLGCQPGVRLEGPIDASVPEKVGEQLLAVLGEALSNVARHAHATEVHVSVDVDTHVTLHVSDNGKGIEPCGRRSGLRNLEERATSLGGTFSAEPSLAGGTLLRWSVPLPDEEGQAPAPQDEEGEVRQNTFPSGSAMR